MQISSRGVAIEVDDRGPAGAEPLLLVMGLGMQLIAWPDELVDDLVSRGFRVIRIDNRDAGLSRAFDEAGPPNLAWAALRYTLRLPVRSAYTLADMADDAFGVLDALGVARAHVCGASMGGMIAQHMAVRQPARIASLVLMMTSSGARHLPQPAAPVRRALLAKSGNRAGPDALVDRLAELFALIGSPAYRPEPQAFRAQLRRSVERAYRPAGVARQLVAVAADGDRSRLLGRIAAPTHVLHGAADPLIPPAAAHDLAAKIRGATLEVVDGMGHDLPPPLLAGFARSIATTAARAHAQDLKASESAASG